MNIKLTIIYIQQVNDFECPSDGVFAIPDECSSSYYFCLDGIAYPQVKTRLIKKPVGNVNKSFPLHCVFFRHAPEDTFSIR